MRVPAAVRLVAIGLALAAGRTATAGEDGPRDYARELEDARFAVRRAAERTLTTEGLSVLVAIAAGDADADTRIAAFERTLDACERSGAPASAEAVRRIAARLDESASDDQAQRFPRLLRARVTRLLPRVVEDPFDPTERDEAAEIVDGAVRGLLPAARGVLLDALRTATDPRALAGAVAILCREDGGGPGHDEDLEILAAEYARDPARFREVGRYRSVVGAPPAVAVGVALVLTGRTDAMRALVATRALDRESLHGWLTARLARQASLDLAMGSFLRRVETGTASADAETEGARRALAAKIPWLARLLARRALFLAPRSEPARALLAASSEAVGLRSVARRDARPAPPPAEPEASDDPAAVAIDDALRAGRLSQRLAHQIEAGSATRRGLVAAAVGGGRIAHAAGGGRIRVVEAASGRELYTFRSGSRDRSAALALHGDDLLELTPQGAAVLWTLGEGAATARWTEKGAWHAVIATPEGFLVAGFHLALLRVEGGKATRVAGVPAMSGFPVVSLARFSDGSFLVPSPAGTVRVDLGSGRVRSVSVPDGASALAVAGDTLLCAVEGAVVRARPDGSTVPLFAVDDGGAILGLATDEAGRTVYVQTIDTLLAVSTDDGAVRWTEHVEGSGDPVVGDGFVLARAGNGSERSFGDGRRDRTIFVLRAAGSLVEAFGPADHAGIVGLALAAAREGRAELADVLADPLRDWLSAEEQARIAAAVDEAARDGARPR